MACLGQWMGAGLCSDPGLLDVWRFTVCSPAWVDLLDLKSKKPPARKDGLSARHLRNEIRSLVLDRYLQVPWRTPRRTGWWVGVEKPAAGCGAPIRPPPEGRAKTVAGLDRWMSG